MLIAAALAFAVAGVAVIFRLAAKKPVNAGNVNEGAPEAAPQMQGAAA